MNELTHFSLFTGIGGIDLAAEWAGFETVGQCEYADYPTKVLEKHWPDVPKWRDIRSVTKESFAERTGLRTVDLISGGDPCQPHSVAGLQKGELDPRYLWPEMFRVISEIQPTWVINENVFGSVSNGTASKKCDDLEGEGYRTVSFCIPACAVGAKHHRERIIIIAYSERNEQRREKPCCRKIGRVGRVIESVSWNGTWESALRKFRRMDDGLSYGVERIDTLRNAVVPQQVYPILKTIADIETQRA